jgi:hypothetical protein
VWTLGIHYLIFNLDAKTLIFSLKTVVGYYQNKLFPHCPTNHKIHLFSEINLIFKTRTAVAGVPESSLDWQHSPTTTQVEIKAVYTYLSPPAQIF